MPNNDIRIALIQLILNDAKDGDLESQHRYIPWQPIVAVNILTKIICARKAGAGCVAPPASAESRVGAEVALCCL
jgi:hypothetical protein